jgi:hypothetical protein
MNIRQSPKSELEKGEGVAIALVRFRKVLNEQVPAFRCHTTHNTPSKYQNSDIRYHPVEPLMAL